jgi:hypothetical protein
MSIDVQNIADEVSNWWRATDVAAGMVLGDRRRAEAADVAGFHAMTERDTRKSWA